MIHNIPQNIPTPYRKSIKINKSNIVCDVSNKIVDKITKKNIYYLLENCPAIKPVS